MPIFATVCQNILSKQKSKPNFINLKTKNYEEITT